MPELLDHTGAEVLAKHLISAGVFTLPSTNNPWPLTVNSMPNLPNVMATIYDTDGILDGREMRGGRTVMHPGWQIRFRAQGYQEANRKGAQVRFAMDSIKRALVAMVAPIKTYRIDAIRQMSPVIPIGQEEGGARYLFTLNGTITYGEA